MFIKDKDINFWCIDQFEGRTRNVWQEYLMNKEFCDVTLYCENKPIQVHKIIISSNSPIFLNILKRDTNVHPIIYLSGVKYLDLENLFKFMYTGEVSIDNDDIGRFLSVAEDLEIKGLSKGNKDVNSKGNSDSQNDMIPPNNINSQPNKLEIDEMSSKKFEPTYQNTNEMNYINNTHAPKIDLSTRTDASKIKPKTEQIIGMTKSNINIEILKDEKSISHTALSFMYEDNLAMKIQSQKQLKIKVSEEIEENIKFMETSELVELHNRKGRSENASFDIYNIDYNLTNTEESSISSSNVSMSDEEYFTLNSSSKLLKYEQLPCENCEYKTEDKSKLKIHMNTIHRVQTFRCNKCSFETKATDRLKIHVDTAHKINHPCEQCEKVYKNKHDLKRHVDTIHEINPTYECKLCDHLAKNEYFLNRHVALIHKKNVPLCTPCNKQFGGRGSLHRHELLVHEGVRTIHTISCGECEKVYKTKYALRKHFQSIHEGVRHSCTHCNYKAGSKGNLRKHVSSIHENGGSHQCDKCDFRGPDKSVLREHIEATHEGILHPCNQCDYKGTRRGSLKFHIRVRHEGLRFFCDRCEYKGTAKSALNEHIRRRH